MPFCDLLNAFFDLFQQTFVFFYGLFGITPTDFATLIGSIMGCNIV
jgi:hypothetical protein